MLLQSKLCSCFFRCVGRTKLMQEYLFCSSLQYPCSVAGCFQYEFLMCLLISVMILAVLHRGDRPQAWRSNPEKQLWMLGVLSSKNRKCEGQHPVSQHNGQRLSSELLSSKKSTPASVLAIHSIHSIQEVLTENILVI